MSDVIYPHVDEELRRRSSSRVSSALMWMRVGSLIWMRVCGSFRAQVAHSPTSISRAMADQGRKHSDRRGKRWRGQTRVASTLTGEASDGVGNCANATIVGIRTPTSQATCARTRTVLGSQLPCDCMFCAMPVWPHVDEDGLTS